MTAVAAFDDVSALIAWTLAHCMWQGALVGGAVAVSLGLLNDSSPRIRHNLLVAAMALMAACPLVTLGILVHRRDANPPGAVVLATTPTSDSSAAAPASFASAPTDGEFEKALDEWEFLNRTVAVAYLIGLLVMCGRALSGVRNGNRLTLAAVEVTQGFLLDLLSRQAGRWGLARVPKLYLSRDLNVPSVAGVLRPVILLPASMASGIDAEQLGVILAHELAHIRRYDHLVHLLQRVAEAVLFFHPAVWYVSHKIRVERERCCDDLVLEEGYKPVVYAQTLLAVADWNQSGSQTIPVLGASGVRSDFYQRVHRFLDDRYDPTAGRRNGLKGVALFSATLLTGFGVALCLAPEESRPRVALADGQATDDAARVQNAVQAAALTRPPPPRILSHVDDSAEGRLSIAASGHAIDFERPADLPYVDRVQLFASRYGTPTPPEEMFRLHLLDTDGNLLARFEVPYALIQRGETSALMRTSQRRIPSPVYPILVSINCLNNGTG